MAELDTQQPSDSYVQSFARGLSVIRAFGPNRSQMTLSEVAAVTGAYTNEAPHYLQTTGFLLTPDGKVANAVYSSGPIGRLVADDVIGMVTYLKSKA